MSAQVPALKVGGLLRVPERTNVFGKVCGPFTQEVLLYELAKIGLDATIDEDTSVSQCIANANGAFTTELTLDMTIVGLNDNNVSSNLFVGFLKHHHIDGTRLSIHETRATCHVYENN